MRGSWVGALWSVSARRRSSDAGSMSSSCSRPRRTPAEAALTRCSACVGACRSRGGNRSIGSGRGGDRRRRLLDPASASGSAATTPSTSPWPLLGNAWGALRNSSSDLVVLRVEAVVTIRRPRNGVGRVVAGTGGPGAASAWRSASE